VYSYTYRLIVEGNFFLCWRSQINWCSCVSYHPEAAIWVHTTTDFFSL